MNGKCKVCGCTDNHGCYHPDLGTCSWTDDQHDLCNHCNDEARKSGVMLELSIGIKTKRVRLLDVQNVLIANIVKEDHDLIFHYAIHIPDIGWKCFDLRKVRLIRDIDQQMIIGYHGNRLPLIKSMIKFLPLESFELNNIDPFFSLL